MTGDPYLLLGVAAQADDDEIKKAYLQKVRQFPPELAPQTFELIRTAYETIRTARDRLQYQLIQSETPDLNALVTGLLNSERTDPGLPGTDLFLRALAAGLLKQKINE